MLHVRIFSQTKTKNIENDELLLGDAVAKRKDEQYTARLFKRLKFLILNL